jgi:hypothetical protein
VVGFPNKHNKKFKKVKKGGFIKKMLQSFVYLTSLETVTRERERQREMGKEKTVRHYVR